MKTTLHKDGTITYWSVYNQQWEIRTWHIPDQELAAMSDKERQKVIKHLKENQS